MLTFVSIDDFARSSTFSVAGACDELFISIATPEGLSFSAALADLTIRYASVLDRMGLSDSTAVFCRIFLSDILNKKSALLQSALFNRLRASCALSIVEQKPVDCGPVSLLSYHLRDPKKAVAKQLSHPTSDGWRT